MIESQISSLLSDINKIVAEISIPILFVDFLFVEMRIYSSTDFSFIFSLINEYFFNGFIEKMTGWGLLISNGNGIHILLCEEIIFPLPKGKNYSLRWKVIFFLKIDLCVMREGDISLVSLVDIPKAERLVIRKTGSDQVKSMKSIIEAWSSNKYKGFSSVKFQNNP